MKGYLSNSILPHKRSFCRGESLAGAYFPVLLEKFRWIDYNKLIFILNESTNRNFLKIKKLVENLGLSEEETVADEAELEEMPIVVYLGKLRNYNTQDMLIKENIVELVLTGKFMTAIISAN